MIWLPTVWTGLNEVIGSWKTSEISTAPDLAHLAPVGRDLDQIERTLPAVPVASGLEEDLTLVDPARAARRSAGSSAR